MAFLAGSKLAYHRPGHYVRQLVAGTKALRGWLLGAVQLAVPAFAAPTELSAIVAERVVLLRRHLDTQHIALLSALVARLLDGGGSLDLSRWVEGVDLTADRAGLLLANDLPRALAVVRATPEEASQLSQTERIGELLRFATGSAYARLRAQLGASIGGAAVAVVG
jgi:hypothetical protein